MRTTEWNLTPSGINGGRSIYVNKLEGGHGGMAYIEVDGAGAVLVVDRNDRKRRTIERHVDLGAAIARCERVVAGKGA